MQQVYAEGTYIHPDFHLTWKKNNKTNQIPVFFWKERSAAAASDLQ
jgi:hypothetical protein